MSTQLILTLISGILIGGVSGYLGTLMLSKKMSIVAGPLAHLAFPGAALALIFGFNMFIGVFPFVIIGAVLIWLLRKKTKLPLENLTAVIFATGVGSALLFLPIDKAEEALIGNITNITFNETILVIILSIVVFYVVKKLYKKMMLMNVDEHLATIEGTDVNLYNLLYLLSIAVIVSLGVYLVGALITAALIAVPAASARNISSSLFSYKVWAIIIGIVSVIIGVFASRFFQLPTGPMIIVVGAVLFVFSIFFRDKAF